MAEPLCGKSIGGLTDCTQPAGHEGSCTATLASGQVIAVGDLENTVRELAMSLRSYSDAMLADLDELDGPALMLRLLARLDYLRQNSTANFTLLSSEFSEVILKARADYAAEVAERARLN